MTNSKSQTSPSNLPNILSTTEDNEVFCRLAEDVFVRRRLLDPYSPGAIYALFIAFLCQVQRFYEQESNEQRPLLRKQAQEISNWFSEQPNLNPDYQAYLQEMIADLSVVPPSPKWRGYQRPWRTEIISEKTTQVPGMLYPDTMRYYKWLTKTHSSSGAIVELGSWLGLSSHCLAEGIQTLPPEQQKPINVVDGFRWQAWMNNNIPDGFPELTQFEEGSSFLELFKRFCQPISQLVHPYCAWFGSNSPWPDVPQFIWSGEPIGILVNDLAGDYQINQTVWQTLSPSFIPQQTIVVFNQYGNARAEGLRRFCREVSNQLRPVHAINGSAKGFLFSGTGRI